MDDSSTIDGDVPILGSSVASVLGIKGSLRFRLHGSTQKAHVVLRRVSLSEDSSDDGEGGNIIRFSLFAQKRIEVKPGKEILLTVASEDSPFKDRPVVLESHIMGEEELSSAEDDTQVAEEEEVDTYIPPLAPVVPPKMRRGWTKKAEEVSPITQRTYSSIAIQAEPVYHSASIMAQPTYVPASIQSQPTYISSSVQVDTLPLISQAPAVAQTIGTDNLKSGVTDKHMAPLGWGSTTDGDVAERSLSPMELDSPPYSPTELSTIIPIETPERPHRPDSRSGRARSPTRSSMGAEDMQLSPVETPVSPTSNEVPLLKNEPFHANKGNEARNLEIQGVSRNALDKSTMSSSRANRSGDPESSNTKTHPFRKSIIPNPFVSAGFMTEFVGLTSVQPSAVTVTDVLTPQVSDGRGIKAEPMSPSQSILELQSNPVESSSPTSTKEVPSRPKVPTLTIPSAPSNLSQPPQTIPIVPQSRTVNLSQNPKVIHTKLSPASQNAIASSSKVSVESIPSTFPSSNMVKIPNGPRSLASLTHRAREKSPITFTPPFGGRTQPHTIINSTSPPPNPKSLAYIPSGPSSNPLNIRPSGNVIGHGALYPLPTVPKALSQPSGKKRVIVGTGWPFVKSSGSSLNSTSPFTPSLSQPTPPPPSGPRSLNLSNIISYASPSPPPPLSTPASDESTSTVVDKSNLPQSWSGPIGEDCAKKDSMGELSRPSVASDPVVKSPQTTYIKDRIGPASLPAKPQSKQSSNPERVFKGLVDSDPRDLHTRIFDPPGFHAVTPDTRQYQELASPPSATPSPQGIPPRPQNTYNTYTNGRTDDSGTPTFVPPAQGPIAHTPTHPLPRRPAILTGGNNTPRGVKRERPPSPDLSMVFSEQHKRSFRWPTVHSNYSVSLKGEGDLGVKTITFSSDGSHFALSCADKTIRIWNNRDRVEIARLSHISSITALSWMYGDTGVVSLGEDGIISKWTRSGQNHWHWAKVLDVGTERLSDDDQICMVYWRDRIAVSFPRKGVKVWIWHKGTWQPQRAILRQNVSAIRFVDDGTALLGGTRDGVLWYCEVPNGTLRAYAFLKNRINSLDISPTGSHVLVGQTGGCARLVGIRQSDNKGAVEQSYSCKETELRANDGFGATFATQGQAILFGNVEGCVLVWDRKKGAIVYGLEHEEDDLIQAVASFDGVLSSKYGCIVTGTKQGLLAWWSQPVAATHPEDPNKRSKLRT